MLIGTSIGQKIIHLRLQADMQGYSKSLICTFLGNGRNFGDWSAQFTGDAPHSHIYWKRRHIRDILSYNHTIGPQTNTIPYVGLIELCNIQT